MKKILFLSVEEIDLIHDALCFCAGKLCIELQNMGQRYEEDPVLSCDMCFQSDMACVKSRLKDFNTLLNRFDNML